MDSNFNHPKSFLKSIRFPIAVQVALILAGLSASVWAGDQAAKMKATFGEVPNEPGFYRLFNGKDLTGWDGQPGSWTVQDGVIQSTGKGKERNWLIWRGFGAADFELRLKFRFKSGNSGVQVRGSDLGDWQVRGYQVEVAEQEVMGLWHHSLMSPEIEIQNTRKHLATAGQRVIVDQQGKKTVEQFAPPETIQANYKEGEWNDLVVIVRGNHLSQIINGVLFADLTDDQAGFSSDTGVIAFQDHGKKADVAFDKIRIKLFEPEARTTTKAKAPEKH